MLHYSKHGTGNNTTIVLLHGFCENSTCFSEQVFFLKEHFSVITPDLPGSGNSAPTDQTSMQSMADDVYRLLKEEKISSCVMIGHSMGGYVTLAFAKKYGEMLNGFGLLHSTANADSDERKQKRDQAIRVIEEKGSDMYVENFIPPLFAPSFKNSKVINDLITQGKKTSVKGLTQALSAMKTREESISFLQETTIPVLFCAGKYDSIIPEFDMLHQASLCRQSEIIYLDQSGHMGYIEEAKKCAEGIVSFSLSCF